MNMDKLYTVYKCLFSPFAPFFFWKVHYPLSDMPIIRVNQAFPTPDPLPIWIWPQVLMAAAEVHAGHLKGGVLKGPLHWPTMKELGLF